MFKTYVIGVFEGEKRNENVPLLSIWNVRKTNIYSVSALFHEKWEKKFLKVGNRFKDLTY